MPEDVTVGESLFYATSFHKGDDVVGLLAECYEGRPTKIEGNPLHPQSLSKSSHIHQASVLSLYDPDRLRNSMKKSSVIEKKEVEFYFRDINRKLANSSGKKIGIFLESKPSPTLHRLLKQLLFKYPNLKFYKYDSVNRDNITQGLFSVTGEYIVPNYNFRKADVVVSFDSDFLGTEISSLKHTRDFVSRRDPDKSSMSRFYAFESNFSITGAKADHRFKLKSSHIEVILWKLAYRIFSHLNVPVSNEFKLGLKKGSSLPLDIPESVVDSISDDILLASRKALLIAGPNQPPSVHALIFVINQVLKNHGNTVGYNVLPFSQSDIVKKTSLDSILGFKKDVLAGRIETLLILGGNPVYSSPVDVGFSDLLSNLKDVVHLSQYYNHTSEYCDLVIPESHFLESWGDLVSTDGVVSFVQPMIKRMHDSFSDIEILSMLLGKYEDDFNLVQETHGVSPLDASWKKWLHDGMKSHSEKSSVFPFKDNGFSKSFDLALNHSEISDDLEVVFVPSFSLYDGRYANNGWLQELSDPITKLTWDNAALINPKTAKKLFLKSEDLVDISSLGKSIETVIFVVPGVADDVIVLTLGYGQNKIGRIGESKGFSVEKLRTSDSFYSLSGVTLIKNKGNYHLATTQEHGSMEGRPHYREADIDYYKNHKDFAHHMVEHPPLKSLFDEIKYDKGYQWGMAIDLAKCVGCNACVVACQSENNIPIVGKKQVRNGREMSWMRIDRYFEGDEENPRVVKQPVTCLHCENAPCEQVCPVAATVHSEEGTNDMAYNRCIGTRYCSDNCPVKVRRFNFLDYHQTNPQSKDKDRFHIFDYRREDK
jgi:Fe-S-cluster-containing dehydrogenase component